MNKFFAILALAAVASAIPVELDYHHQEEHHAPAHYEFKYDVHDAHTGDIKSQQETRHDDKVEGHYTLVEPDGHRRIVHYTANDHDGFNAKVDREYVGGHQEQTHKIIAAPVVHKTVIAAPQLHYSAGSHGLSDYHH